MSTRQIISETQIENAERVLNVLQREIAAEYIGLISTSGVSLINLTSSDAIDNDALASLAAGSFAATRQLAAMMDEGDFSVLLHEGSEFNIYIAQITPDSLLVICFRKDTEIGRVRLISKRALHLLAHALEHKPGSEKAGVIAESAQKVPHTADKTDEEGHSSGAHKSRGW